MSIRTIEDKEKKEVLAGVAFSLTYLFPSIFPPRSTPAGESFFQNLYRKNELGRSDVLDSGEDSGQRPFQTQEQTRERFLLVKWVGLPTEDATWVDAEARYPDFNA